MRQYLNLLQDVLDNGVVKNDRTGVGTLSVFGRQARFSLAAGFPLLTTKKLHWKSIVHELLWFLRGDTNIAYLQSAGVSIWDEWADENGDMGPIYGRQWRAWPTDNGAIDQIYKVIDALRNNPDSRRIIVCAWNVGELPQMRLALVSCLVSILCRQRQAVVSVISTQRRFVFGRAFQHRLLCAINFNACTSLRSSTR